MTGIRKNWKQLCAAAGMLISLQACSVVEGFNPITNSNKGVAAKGIHDPSLDPVSYDQIFNHIDSTGFARGGLGHCRIDGITLAKRLNRDVNVLCQEIFIYRIQCNQRDCTPLGRLLYNPNMPVEYRPNDWQTLPRVGF